MSSVNAQFAVWFLVLIVVVVVLYGKKNGFAMDKMVPAISGGALTYFVVMFLFWYGAQLGWWGLGFSSSHVSVDDKFADGYNSIVTGSMLNSDGMSGVDLGDDESSSAAMSSDSGDHDKWESEDDLPASTGPRSDSAIDPSAAVVEVVWPTATPQPTPVTYLPTKPRKEMLKEWRVWFINANYNRGNVNKTKIPAGVSCRILRTSSKSWFGLRGDNVWTMRCFDPANEDYGQVDINLTERAKTELGVAGDEGLIEGTGKWPNGFFVPGEPQSQAPASAPGPASAAQPASNLVGPDVFPNVYTQWLYIDAPAGVDCTTEGQVHKLPGGSRYRFDPQVVKDNGVPNEMTKVQVVIAANGASCWAPLFFGLTHIVQP